MQELGKDAVPILGTSEGKSWNEGLCSISAKEWTCQPIPCPKAQGVMGKSEILRPAPNGGIIQLRIRSTRCPLAALMDWNR